MRALEGGGDLFNLPTRLFGAEIDRRANGDRPHVERLLDAGVQSLVILGRVAQRFVMVELNKEWNAVRVAARYRGQYAIGRATQLQPASMASSTIFFGSK